MQTLRVRQGPQHRPLKAGPIQGHGLNIIAVSLLLLLEQLRNVGSGVATAVGPTGLPSLTGIEFDNSLASNGTTLYYTLDTNGGPGTLYTLNTTTGAATAVGPLGVNGIVGSAFAGPTFGTGQLYGFSTSGATYAINLTTGQATFLNSNGIGDIFGGVGIVTEAAISAPEPSTIVLLGTAAATLGGYSWRRRKQLVKA